MGITLKNNKSVTKNMTIKGDNGVGIKTITSGTPVVTEEKTTTPITVTLTDETTQNFNVEAKNGSGTDNALTKPTTAPETTKLVAVDTANSQKMLTIGDGLSIENDTLKASGGTGTKKYFHQISLLNSPNDSVFYFNLVTTTPVFNYGPDAFNEAPDNLFISYSPLSSTGTLGHLTIGARKQSNELVVIRVDLVTREMSSTFFPMESLDLLEDNSVEL